MKKVLTTIVLILLAGYITLATMTLCNKPDGQVCQGIRLEIRDSLKAGLMTTNDIATLLAKNNLDPTGKPFDEVSLQAIEKVLNASPLIASGECYKTISGHIVVEVECRRPILRVMADGYDSYYIDEEGEVIEHIGKAVYVPVVTGHVTREFAKEKLFELAQYLRDNELWNAQIEQIHVTLRKEIELTPRVGNHVIALGFPDNYAHKFGKLQAFYEKGLNEVGWDRYSRIDIGHGNQVVATKREN